MVSKTNAMFASASSDGVVNVWDVSFPSHSSGMHLVPLQTLPPTVYSIRVNQDFVLVFFVADECKVLCLDSFSADSKAIVTLSLAELPQNPGRFALAMGGLDNKIKLYSGERTGKVGHAFAFLRYLLSDLDFMSVFFYSSFSLLRFVSLKATRIGFGVWTSHYR